MRNINELIGTIKGIKSLGTIKDRDVMYLQSWVDKNRNLAYEQRQVELIKLVDDVLEDHVIDEIEKKRLISISEELLNEMGDDSGRIYELNSIIEGIIIDGEINKLGLVSLQEWLETYGDWARNNIKTQNLFKIIDDILEDGVVTEEKQAELLDILGQKIRDAQFETKLEYLCKLVKERKNIGVELIDILYNEYAMTEIHRRAERQLLIAVNSMSGFCNKPEIIIVSLVLIAMLEYDGNYYKSVRDTYKQVYSKYTSQKVEGTIRSILGRYKKQNESGTRERIINVALENAIVPKNFLSAFFEFIFDIYKLNFDCDLPEDPYEDFEFVFEGLRSNMLSDGDDISINVTQKTYKLTAATKQLISREDGVDAIIKLSILIVKLIDRRFWNKEIKIFNPYLRVGYEGWEKQLKESDHGGRRTRGSSGELRSHWEPKFVLGNNNTIYLVPPVHRIKSQYDYHKVAVVILNDDKEIYYDGNCYIKEIIGGYQIEPRKIKIDKPLGKMKYRLQCGDKIIYDSKDKLYRNCIVFSDDGQEISNNTDYKGTAYFVYKAGEAELNSILTKEYYCIGYKLVRMGDTVSVGNDIFNFSSKVKPGILGQLHKNCQVKVSKNCCDENTSCYNCLRNYYNQSHHSKLKRKLAIDVINRLLFEIDGVSATTQNERWHWKSDIKRSKEMKLVLGSDGRNPGTETAEEIWEDLLDDCYDDDETTLIEALKEKSPEIISRPYYSKTVKIEETGEKFVANLIWYSKKVILLLNDAEESYELAKKTGWYVYCTKEGFDVNELLQKVSE